MTDLRDAMRAAVKGDLSAIDVPEWEQKVYIRKLSVREQIGISETTKDPMMEGLKILLVSIVDENGDRLLAEGDMDLLLDQPSATLVPLLKEAAKQNGMTAEELEEAVASFRKAPGEASSTE